MAELSVACLPPDVLQLVLAKLGGDVASLCAASCVSKAWHAAASRPEAWHVIRVKGDSAPPPLARKLTDARLVQLLSRCVEGTPAVGTRQRHRLSSLNLDRCELVTDAGLAPLRKKSRAQRLRYVSLVGCTSVTLASLAETLRAALGQSKLRKLSVRGLVWRTRGEGDPVTHEERGDATESQLQQLRTLLKRPDALDVRERCVGVASRPCLAFVRKVVHACGACPTTLCKWCKHHDNGQVQPCCGNYACGDCLEGHLSYSDDEVCPVCNAGGSGSDGWGSEFYSDEDKGEDEYDDF